MSELKVTSLQELQEYKKGRLVELPPFAEGQPFVARLNRPSMLVLVKSGKIPNELLTSAQNLFAKGGQALGDAGDSKLMEKVFGVMDVMCEASFVEPKYSELREAGIELTDDQYMFVFNYAQQGVKALESFRKEQADNKPGGNGEPVQGTTE